MEMVVPCGEKNHCFTCLEDTRVYTCVKTHMCICMLCVCVRAHMLGAVETGESWQLSDFLFLVSIPCSPLSPTEKYKQGL